MDFAGLGFVGLIAIGAVNVASWRFPNLTSMQKFAISVVVAFAASFIPVEIGNMIYDKLVLAISVALGSSGVYKISQVVGKKNLTTEKL